MSNYWDNLMETDDNASVYMYSYGEGPGTETRHVIGNFINEGESVLDVGCGPGWNADHFVEYGPLISRYKGTDLSPRFVRVANKRRVENGWDNEILPFEVGDMRDIKEPDESWDVVILQDALEHTNGYEKPVSEALRVAKKRVIISFWRMNPFRENKINDDTKEGTDGYGAEYNQLDWEKYLNTLDYPWMDTETSKKANRPHLFYIIDKEVKS